MIDKKFDLSSYNDLEVSILEIICTKAQRELQQECDRVKGNCMFCKNRRLCHDVQTFVDAICNEQDSRGIIPPYIG